MTNFDVLKQEISKCNNAHEFTELLENWRYTIFPCESNDKCIKSILPCFSCYLEWLDEEQKFI